MRTTEIRPAVRNMSITIPGLFICIMLVPSPSHADPFWSIGFSGGSSGINGFTFSISDYCRIPVYADHYGPPCGQAYGSYEKYPRYRNNYRSDVPPHSLSRPNGRHGNAPRPDRYIQDTNRAYPRNQSYSGPDGYQQSRYGNTHYVQGTGTRDKGTKGVSRPDREKQRQWETRMMNTSVAYPR